MLLRLLRDLLTEFLCDLHFCYVYIDDVLITSTDAEEHKHHLHLAINPYKCQFGVTQLNFMGHSVNS